MRNTFDEHGSIADAIPHKPAVKRYTCFATDCPMPGSITIAGNDVCAWHYGVHGHDVPRVTRVLLDWQCATYEINEARRALTGELSANPGALDALFGAAWERLKPLVPGWEDQIAPKRAETYAEWVKRLERFIGGQVVATLRQQFGKAA